jgi:pimeloyl-ACP methyl ester carboxylesterase
MPEVERHMTLVYVEPIGTGNSGRLDDPSGYTLDRYVRQVDGLIEHLGQERTYVLGHSYGGFVAQRYALLYPGRLAGLILYDTSPTTTQDFHADIGENLGRFAGRNADEPWLADTMAAWQEVSAATADPDVSDEQLTGIFHRMFPAYLADYRGRQREFAPTLAGVARVRRARPRRRAHAARREGRARVHHGSDAHHRRPARRHLLASVVAPPSRGHSRLGASRLRRERPLCALRRARNLLLGDPRVDRGLVCRSGLRVRQSGDLPPGERLCLKGEWRVQPEYGPVFGT